MDESQNYITPGSDESVQASAALNTGNPARKAYDAEYNALGIKTNLAIPLTQVGSANNAGMKDVVGGSGAQTTQNPISPTGDVRSSASVGYNDGKGWWIGFDQGIPKFFLGNSAGNKVTWDGTTLSISGAVSASSLDIPDTTTANSFHVDNQGNTWWGANLATGYAGAPAKVLNTGAASFSNVTITGGSITTTPISGIPNNSSTDVSLLEFTQNIVFTSASATQVNWASGTINLSNGRTFSISSGNTGTMAALTYIYLNPAVSSTVLQTTTTYSTAIGANKILIAVAQNNAVAASVLTYGGGQPILDGAGQIAALSITAGSIAASTITAAKMNVSQLSAITADMGTLTAGNITLPSGGFVRSGQTAYDTGTGWFIGNPSGTPELSIGNSAGQKLTWDGTTLNLVGNLTVGNVLTAAESITAGDAIAAGYYQTDGGIKFDAKASGSGASTSVSQAITVGANSNRILIASLTSEHTFTFSSVQFNGVSMTLLDSQVGTDGRMSTYYLTAPATGTHNFTATISSGAKATGWLVYSYYNAKQSAQPDAHSITSILSSSGSLTLAPTVIGSLMFDISEGVDSTTGSYSGAPGTFTGAPNNLSLNTGDNGQSSSTATQTYAYTAGSGSVEYFLSMISIAPFTAATLGACVKASSALSSSYSTPTSDNFRSTAFIGFAYNTASAGNPCTVVVSGTAPGLSGLTPFANYYLNDTAGTIGTTAGTITRKAGIATSTTMLTITNIW